MKLKETDNGHYFCRWAEGREAAPPEEVWRWWVAAAGECTVVGRRTVMPASTARRAGALITRSAGALRRAVLTPNRCCQRPIHHTAYSSCYTFCCHGQRAPKAASSHSSKTRRPPPHHHDASGLHLEHCRLQLLRLHAGRGRRRRRARGRAVGLQAHNGL